MKYKALLFSLFATANLFAQHPAIHFEIETDQPCQTMDYFGASDCWSMQFIGLWPQEKQNQVADWLFSTENHENGQPKGIGLSLWRFNVGAGSAEQGEASQIASPWMYNPQIQISAESETKRSIFREKDKTKRSKKESAQHSKSRNKSFVMTSVSAL